MDKKTGRKIGKIVNMGIGAVLFFLMPVVSYLLFESVTGNLGQVSRPAAVWNILWMLVLYLLAFGVCGSNRVAAPIVSVGLYVLSLAEAFVVEFRGNPIMPWDIFAFGTAMSVAENYSFALSEEMRQAGTVVAAVNLLLLFFPVRVKGWKKRLAAAAVSAGFCLGYGRVFYGSIVPGQGLQINMWAVESSYQNYGYVLATALSLQYTVRKPPYGYSHARLEQLQRQTEDAEDGAGKGRGDSEGGIQPVNIICIMNESLADLSVAGEFTTNRDYFSFLHHLTENTVKGSLCVPVFGAMTSNTEFEFLTGDSMAMFPANTTAYQFYVHPGMNSLVSTLKAQGYTTVAMHPYPPENWNRDKCYASFGFDKFLSWDDFQGTEVLRNYVSDRGNYGKIIEQVEDKTNPEDRLFVFNVTMQNHGGYEGEYENFVQEIYLTGKYRGKYPKADHYLSLMKKSDEAFGELVDYFRDCPQPTMLVLFGDHQPGIEDEFYDEIAGKPSWEMEAPKHLIWYQTPFVIWTNYPQQEKDLGKLGTVFLSSHVLELANLRMSPYQKFLLGLSGALPVIHPIGCYAQDGTYYSWEEAESEQCPYRAMVLDYEAMAYNHSLDSHKAEGLFSVGE